MSDHRRPTQGDRKRGATYWTVVLALAVLLSLPLIGVAVDIAAAPQPVPQTGMELLP